MVVYENMKAMSHSSDDKADFIDIVTGILQGNTPAPCLFMIRLNY